MAVAVVTGAGIRVGRAIATELGQAGYNLILHAHSSGTEVASLADELGRLESIINAESATDPFTATQRRTLR